MEPTKGDEEFAECCATLLERLQIAKEKTSNPMSFMFELLEKNKIINVE